MNLLLSDADLDIELKDWKKSEVDFVTLQLLRQWIREHFLKRAANCYFNSFQHKYRK